MESIQIDVKKGATKWKFQYLRVLEDMVSESDIVNLMKKNT